MKKMLFFAKCVLKMLFRKGIRLKMILLVISMLLILGINSFLYIKSYINIQHDKNHLIDELAFQVYFLKLSEQIDVSNLKEKFTDIDPQNYIVLKNTFVSAKNYLYLDVLPSNKDYDGNSYSEKEIYALQKIYRLFSCEDFVKQFKDEDFLQFPNVAFCYGGQNLPKKIKEDENDTLKNATISSQINSKHVFFGTTQDFMPGLYENNPKYKMWRDRREAFLKSFQVIDIDSISEQTEINKFMSNIQYIILLNPTYTFLNMRDLPNLFDEEMQVEFNNNKITGNSFLFAPPSKKTIAIFMNDKIPRYIPLIVKNNLETDNDFYGTIKVKPVINVINKEFNKGGFSTILSPLKIEFLYQTVENINKRLKSSFKIFIWMDILISFLFPLVFVFISFIYLKVEIAFIFISKNIRRDLLMPFYFVPLLFLLVKQIIVACFVYNMIPVLFAELLVLAGINLGLYYLIFREFYIKTQNTYSAFHGN